jgi:uncharacterized membrane protein
MSEEFENSDMGMDDDVTSDDKLWSLLGYIFPLIAVVVLFMEDKKNRPFLRYHAIHAIMFGVLTAVLSITACGWIIPWIWGIVIGFQAYGGAKPTVPFLTDFATGQGWI